MGENESPEALKFSIELIEGIDHEETLEIKDQRGKEMFVVIPTLSIPEVVKVFQQAGVKSLKQLENIREAVPSEGAVDFTDLAAMSPVLFKALDLFAYRALKHTDKRMTRSMLSAFSPLTRLSLGQRVLAQTGFGGEGMAQFFRPPRT